MQLWFSYQKLTQMQLLRGRDSTVVWCLPWAACGVLYIPQMQLCRGRQGHQGPVHTTNAALQRSPNHSCVQCMQYSVQQSQQSQSIKHWEKFANIYHYYLWTIFDKYILKESLRPGLVLISSTFFALHTVLVLCLIYTRPDLCFISMPCI